MIRRTLEAGVSTIIFLRIDTMSSGAVRYTPEYSFEEYELWEGDWELWEGVPVSMSPSPVPRHQMVAGNVYSTLKSAVEASACNCVILYETDWRIRPNTVVRPDIAVICNGVPETFIDYPPAVVVEVLSPATEEKDRTAKKQLYESQGVDVYLIADPATETIEAMRLAEGVYIPIEADGETLTIDWNGQCRALIDVAAVFSE